MNNSSRVGSLTVKTAAFQAAYGGSNPAPTLQLSDVFFQCANKDAAVDFVRANHSRLPKVQAAPWKYAFIASVVGGQIIAAALWNNPSARCLPSHWIELRRLAGAPGIPKNLCSAFLGWMVRWLKKNAPEHEKAISYQDLDVHAGTIYRASGWEVEYVSKRRVRDRSKPRKGTNRAYRSNLNGTLIDSAPKARWAKKLV